MAATDRTHESTTTGSPRHPAGPLADRPLPERIGRYVIRRELGRGGMGFVYEAEDPRLKRTVALKIVPQELAGDPERRAQFEREAQILASIRHPNIATIHSFEEAAGTTFLTMEMVSGESLSAFLARGALPIEFALRTCRQVALALEAAHRSGVVHCDLKPQNIMLSKEGEVKLLDFGLAAVPVEHASPAAGDSVDPSPASDPEIAGTPSYMSPEQWSGAEVTPRIDLWAFGCVLYECLAGRRAFSGGIQREARGQRIVGPDFALLPSETPTEVTALVRRCLAGEPSDRPETILVVRRAIEEALAQGPGAGIGDARLTGAALHNLPRRNSPFVGRLAEKHEVGKLLAGERLVTLTGAGGTGKTRLAIEAATSALPRFPGGAWLVDLSPLSDPELLPLTVSAALRVQEESGRALLDTLVARLADRPPLLLVLDNAEHLLAACAHLAEALLQQVPGIRLLVTSREPLGITGEWTFHVRPLAVPDDDDAQPPAELAQVEAVRLLLDRLRAVDPRFELTTENAPAVSRICRRLDGIPLALELAAARARVLPVEAIADRLGDRFRLLNAGSRTALPRHQTLRALIDWSYDQLTELEQTLFRRLAAFAGGWTLEAAEEVAAFGALDSWAVVDLLFQLVSKSVVERDEVGEAATGLTRYRMLETIRDYARDRLLAAGEAEAIARRHRQYFSELAATAAPKLIGPQQAHWLARLDAEQDNLRRAIDGFAAPGEIESALKMARALGRYWMTRARYSEGLAVCEGLLWLTKETPSEARPGALFWLGIFRSYRGDLSGASQAGEEFLACCRAAGDERGSATALNQLGAIAEQQTDFARARACYEESLSIRRRIDDRAGIAQSLNNLGVVAMRDGEPKQALAYYEESLAIRKERGDQLAIAQSLHNLGVAWSWLHELDRANACYVASLKIAREVGDPHGVAGTLTNLGAVAIWSDQLAEARGFLEEALPLWQRLGIDYGRAETIETAGVLLGKEGRPVDAVKLLAVAENLRTRTGILHSAYEEEQLAGVIDLLRATLGAERFDQIWSEGQSMSTDDASTLALSAVAS
jgi:non-specific serine/threonine protein kinase